MKRFATLVTIAAVLTAAPAAAQHAGHGEHHPPAKADSAAGHSVEHVSGWKELDAYHMVMMHAWHPAKATRDLAPARARAGALAAHADTLAAGSVPAPCASEATRAGVAKVRDGSRAFARLVAARADDTATLAALRELHDRFELVNRACKAK